MNKKGNALAVGIFFIVVVVVFALGYMFAYDAFDEVFDDVYDDVTLNESKEVLEETHSRYPATFDGVMLLLFALVWVGGLGSALVKEEHPVLFGVMMFVVLFVLVSGMLLANSYEEIFQDSDLIDLPNTFPATHFIITHILELGIGMILTILLAVMAKNRA